MKQAIWILDYVPACVTVGIGIFAGLTALLMTARVGVGTFAARLLLLILPREQIMEPF